MADDVLTHAELEALLSTSKPRPRPRTLGVTPAETSRRVLSAAANAAREAVKLYDFQRPRSVNDAQLRTLWAIHERLAASLGGALGSLARVDVGVRLVGIDQVAYGQWTSGLDDPTCLNVLRATPLSGEVALDISPAALFPIFDRMLGGGREPSPMVRRPLTAIELRLASRVTGVFLAELEKAWADVADVRFSVERVETDPHCAGIVLPGEGVVRVRLDVAIEAAHGTVTICLPGCALRPVADALSGTQSAAGSRPGTSRETIAQMTHSVGQATVELVAQLATTRVTAGEMLHLRPGDIITTPRETGTALVVSVAGVPKFLAHGGVVHGHNAVQISQVIDPPRDGR